MNEETRNLRFRQLKLMKQKQKQLNRKEIAKEGLQEARKKLADEKTEEDIEKQKDKLRSKDLKLRRLKDLNYSIDEIEKWEEKTQRKQEGFQNFEQLAESAYLKRSARTIIDQQLYDKQKENAQDGMDYTSKIPKKKIEEVVSDYKDSNYNKTRKLKKKSKQDETSSFINDKNRQFNEKLDRHYGEYTKEIKDAFKRGSAL